VLGTPMAPIRFCAEPAEASPWRSIIVRSNVNVSSAFRYVELEDGGAEGAALVLETGVVVDHVQIVGSRADGVWATDFAPTSNSLSVRGSLGAAAVLTGFGAAARFPVGGALTSNQDDVVRLRFSDITENTTLYALGVPYLQEASVRVHDAVFTVEAGVDYQFGAEAGLEIGWNGADATLLVNGTAAAPVVFQGAVAEPGHWGGLAIRQNVRTNSVLQDVRLLHGGGNEIPAISVESPVILAGVSLDQNQTGIHVAGRGLGAESTALSVTGTSGVPLRVAPDALISLPTGGTLTGNMDDHIDVEGGDYRASGTVPHLGVPYRVLGSIEALADSALTLTPGTEFVMAAGTRLGIGEDGSATTLIAEGTAAAPIQFRGASATAGFWTGLVVGNSAAGGSRLSYVRIAHGGAEGACLVLGGPVVVNDSAFSDCAGYGVLRAAADTTDYATSNTFTNVGAGNVGTF
jgi:hypothetical protein